VALVPQATEHCRDEIFVAKERIPAIILEIRGYDCRFLPIPFFHQFEKDVRLLRAEIQVTHFVD
jgi:hypothetical protein